MTEQWLRKQGNQPLFKEMLWDKPENKRHAGKLLIIGGNEYSFATIAEAHSAAEKAGVGVCQILMPESLQKIVGSSLEFNSFAPSNASGSFAQTSIAEWLSHATWSDGVLVAGDLGKNSETAIVLEKFATKYSDILVIAQDGVDAVISNPQTFLGRPQTTLVISFAQLQKLATQIQFTEAFLSDSPIQVLAHKLRSLTTNIQANIIFHHHSHIYIAVDNSVSITEYNKSSDGDDRWVTRIAAWVSTWLIQNPHKEFAALNCAAYELSQLKTQD